MMGIVARGCKLNGGSQAGGYHIAMLTRLTLAFLVLACLNGPTRASADLPDLGDAAAAELPWALERRIGEDYMHDIRSRDPAFIDDAEALDYLDRLGRRLLAGASGIRQDFEFFLLRDATFNAFAMPGGFIGVHSGLVQAAQSESELASVIAHEIAHVTQRHLARLSAKQSQSQALAMLSALVAIMAARNNPDLAQGAMLAGVGAGLQTQLNYTRDFEREADRLGLELLDKAGFDLRGMVSFFERMQRYGRLYENGAPGWLRTHPLTVERLTDIDNRIAGRAYRQVTDSLDFQLMRAKLRAAEGSPQEAMAEFAAQLKERKFLSEAAARYGLARAALRAGELDIVKRELAALEKAKLAHPMIETLAADHLTRQGDPAAAARRLGEAVQRWPDSRPLLYARLDALLAIGQAAEALAQTRSARALRPSDFRLWSSEAKALGALGDRSGQHRAQAEAYLLQGLRRAAIEQLELAQRLSGGDFYQVSQIDARLRELKRLEAEAMRERGREKATERGEGRR